MDDGMGFASWPEIIFRFALFAGGGAFFIWFMNVWRKARLWDEEEERKEREYRAKRRGVEIVDAATQLSAAERCLAREPTGENFSALLAAQERVRDDDRERARSAGNGSLTNQGVNPRPR